MSLEFVYQHFFAPLFVVLIWFLVQPLVPDELSIVVRIALIIVLVVVAYFLQKVKIIKRILTIIYDKIYLFFTKPRKVFIGLAFPEGITQQLAENCNTQINNLGFGQKFTFFDASNRADYKKVESVEKWLKETAKDVYLIIWVNPDMPKRSSGELIINFTYVDDVNKMFSALVRQEIVSLFSQGNFIRLFSDQLDIDIELEYKNITEIGLYLTVLAITRFNDPSKTQSLFERILTTETSEWMREKTLPILQNIYAARAFAGYSKNRYHKSREILEKSYNLNPNHFNTLTGLALARQKTGDENGAEELVEELLKKYPNEAITHVDVAYFRIVSKRYKSALNHYNAYKSLNPHPATTIEVIGFLNEQIHRNEPAVLFAMGYLEHMIGDDQYKKDLKDFLKRASTTDHKLMIRETKRILKNKI